MNPNTFNSLLHPNPSGLHDPALGPCDKQELCGTCGLNYVHCPGHIGHIILPLSVFHPIFFQNLYKILRGSCFVCSRFLCTQYKAQVIKGHIALLDRGLVSEALELESSVSESLSESDGEHTIAERTLLCPLVQALGISKYDLQAIKIFFFSNNQVLHFI